MIICVHCGTRNMEGTYFCEECGRSILRSSRPGTKAGSTVAVSPEQPVINTYLDTNPGEGRVFGGTTYIGKSTEIIIKINDIEVMRIQPSQEMIMGRSDTGTSFTPDIDLAHQNALELGVSRRHAKLKVNDGEITLIDLNSSNGTFLNGQRLVPNQPRVLHNGDEVRVGKLVTHIFFVQS